MRLLVLFVSLFYRQLESNNNACEGFSVHNLKTKNAHRESSFSLLAGLGSGSYLDALSAKPNPKVAQSHQVGHGAAVQEQSMQQQQQNVYPSMYQSIQKQEPYRSSPQATTTTTTTTATQQLRPPATGRESDFLSSLDTKSYEYQYQMMLDGNRQQQQLQQQSKPSNTPGSPDSRDRRKDDKALANGQEPSLVVELKPSHSSVVVETATATQQQPPATGRESDFLSSLDPKSYEYQYQMMLNGYRQQQQLQQQSKPSNTAESPDFVQSIDHSKDEKALTNGQEPSLVVDLKQFQPSVVVDTTILDLTLLSAKNDDDEVEKKRQDEFLKMVSNEVAVKRLNGENPYAITDLPVDVMWSRTLDLAEDALLKLRQYEKGRPYKEGRKTIVVLGSGWGAHAFVKLASTYDLRIIVVSPVNHFVFTPMLASAAVGTVEYRSMTEPIRNTNPEINNFIEGKAVGIDVEKQQVKIQLNSVVLKGGKKENVTFKGGKAEGEDFIWLEYDHLVCAVGTSVRSTIVPGAAEHCYNLKTSMDSKKLRTAIGEALEYASRPTVADDDMERQRRVRFVIIGGGPTGVELAAELNDFLQEVCRENRDKAPYRKLGEDYSVVLVHGGSELLPQFDKQLRQRAKQALEQRGVQVILNTRLKLVGEDFVKLQEKGSEEVITMPVGLTVWAAGNAPVPFVKELLSQLPESAAGSAGRIKVDQWLRCPTHSAKAFGSILVLGDAACLETAKDLKSGDSSLPQTAQVAGQQGAFCARLLNRGYDLSTTPPRLPQYDEENEFSKQRIWLLARGLDEAPDFFFLNLGLLAYVGGGEALTQVQVGQVPILNLAGKRAFALWRSVYLAKQAATRNQAMLALDWMRTELFGRDITRL